MNEEVARLKATEGISCEAADNVALAKQIETHRDLHQKQVAQLRQEINNRQALIDDLKE